MKRDFLKLSTGYMPRPRLDALLKSGLNYPLISVIAGPGYGKTMAVAGFARTTPLRLIWLRLQESDRDIYRFWTHFTEAVSRELPELAALLHQISLPALLGDYDKITQLFATELQNGSPVLIVLDNFERAFSHYLLRLLQLLTKVELPDLHIIVISNEKLPIGGIVPSSGQLRISMDDLSFTTEEITELFQRNGLDFSPDEIQKIADSTGRWPLALHLICVNHNGENVDALREKTHQQLAAELFEQHYFSNFRDEMKLLLVQLSCFDRFPLELVKALTSTDVEWIVDELSRNVFISYDFSTELFQFQNMYRAFLNHRQALLPDSQKVEMFGFMGDWYLENGFFYEALDCFWNISDYDRYLGTVSQLPKTRVGVDITSEILHHLNKFPADYAQANPIIDYCKAVLLLNSMQVVEARGILQGLLRRLEDLGEKEEEMLLLLGDIHVVLADISLFLNRDDGLEHMKKAVEYLPHGCRIRTRDLMLVGNNSVFFLPDNKPGQLARMVDYFFEYALYSDLVANGSGYGHEWLFAAQAAFLSEQFDQARENCFQAIAKAKITAQHDIISNAYWELVRIDLYTGDYRQAKRWLDELVSYIDTRRIQALYELRDCATSWFSIRVGDSGNVAPWVAEVAPIRSNEILEVGRNRLIIIYYLCEQGRLNEAYAEITRLEDILRYNGRWHEKSLLLIYKSTRLLERGDKREALKVFKLAYDMVYQNNISIIFTEFGKYMQKIIRAANAQTDIAFDHEWLDMVYKKAGSFEKRANAMRKAHRHKNTSYNAGDYNLNAKEKEILTYISQGMTRNEISLLMNTSVFNIKRYINNIYTKLGALNRADAIHIATLNGIIDGLDD